MATTDEIESNEDVITSLLDNDVIFIVMLYDYDPDVKLIQVGQDAMRALPDLAITAIEINKYLMNKRGLVLNKMEKLNNE
ncbi:hypothetical protein CU097_004810, partial [Rhizopus azygosporus]